MSKKTSRSSISVEKMISNEQVWHFKLDEYVLESCCTELCHRQWYCTGLLKICEEGINLMWRVLTAKFKKFLKLFLSPVKFFSGVWGEWMAERMLGATVEIRPRFLMCLRAATLQAKEVTPRRQLTTRAGGRGVASEGNVGLENDAQVSGCC